MSNVTVVEKTEFIGSKRLKIAYLESKLGDLNHDIRSISVLRDTFVVSDLLDGFCYTIARDESSYQLTFALKDGSQLVAAVEPSADVTLVAHKIAEGLWATRTRTRQPESDRPKTGPMKSPTGIL